MIRKLRLKFVCVNMGIVTVMLLVIFSTVLRFTQLDMERQVQGTLESLLTSSGSIFWNWVDKDREAQLPGFRVNLDQNRGVVNAVSGSVDITDLQNLPQILEQIWQSGEESGQVEGYDLWYRYQRTPFGWAVAFADTSSHQATLDNLYKNCALIAVFSLLLFLGISFLLARWAVRPVEQAWTQQRQFVADASHELKTPLTVIMTNAELLQDSERSQEEREKFTDNILTMTRQMRGLVEGLLDLARADRGADTGTFAPLDYSELTANCLLPFEPVYFEKGLFLESQIEEGIRGRGGEDRLRQVLDILLDNGVKYTSDAGTVRVTLRRQGSQCLLRVAGPGEAISREDLKNIFRRFYRRDQSRTGGGSYGLGLAIADGIVREHGGRIWAESAGGINSFLVQLPVHSG